jgi:subtilisin family serine protease
MKYIPTPRAMLLALAALLAACADQQPPTAPASPLQQAGGRPEECVSSYEATCYTDAELVASVRSHEGKVFIGIAPEGFPSPAEAARENRMPQVPAAEWAGRLNALRSFGISLDQDLRSVSAISATIRPEDAPRLRKLPFVWYVEPQYQRCIHPVDPTTTRGSRAVCLPPDEGGIQTPMAYSEAYPDLRLTQLIGWNVNDTQVSHPYGPWGNGYKGQGMTVGVIDGEVMIAHPKLSANFIDRRNYTSEPFGTPDGHATWVAGAIVAPDNGFGTVGAAPAARYYNGKVCTASGSCSLAGTLNAVDWLSGIGVHVLNISLGGSNGQCSLTERNRLQQAVSRGTVIVVAAGENAPVTIDRSPYGCYDGDIDQIRGIAGLISVSAHDINGWPTTYDWYSPNRNAALFPSPGDSVLQYNARTPGPSISAPGGEDPDQYLDASPYSTFVPGAYLGPKCADYNNDGYAPCEGTSMAAPIVAGIALVRKQQYTGDLPYETEYALYAAAVVRGWYCSATAPCPTRPANYTRYGAGRAGVNW